MTTPAPTPDAAPAGPPDTGLPDAGIGDARHGGAPGATRAQEFPNHPTQVAAARDLVTDWLTAFEAPDVADVAALCISELFTNAVVHAGGWGRRAAEDAEDADERGGTITVSIHVDATSFLFAVHDADTTVPEIAVEDLTRGSGRGIMLLNALADAWGVERYGDGKRVWFRLRR